LIAFPPEMGKKAIKKTRPIQSQIQNRQTLQARIANIR
jgi:hypothetical protein